MKKTNKMYVSPEVAACELLLKTSICSGGATVTAPGMGPGDPPGSFGNIDIPEDAPRRYF